MKNITDLIQILLTMPGAWGYGGALICVLMFWQAAKVVRRCWQALRWVLGRLLITFHKQTPKGRRLNFAVLAGFFLLAGVVFALRVPICDGLQTVEQLYMSPVYAVSDTSAYVTRVYETEMSKHLSEKELQSVRAWSEKTAAALGCSVLDLYQVAYVECSLDPFRVRTDGNAAGWIQFTRAGLDGLGATLNEVKAMCARRDVDGIMSLTHDYLTRYAPLRSATAVYVAVAASGHAGQIDPSHVIYTRSEHPNEYRLNAALWDGWTVEGGRVLRLARNVDGRITVSDLAGCLEAKKSELIRRFEK